MIRYFLFFLLPLLLLSCSSENTSEEEVNPSEQGSSDDNDEASEDESDERRLPNIAVLGANFQTFDNPKLLTFDSDYSSFSALELKDIFPNIYGDRTYYSDNGIVYMQQSGAGQEFPVLRYDANLQQHTVLDYSQFIEQLYFDDYNTAYNFDDHWITSFSQRSGEFDIWRLKVYNVNNQAHSVVELGEIDISFNSQHYIYGDVIVYISSSEISGHPDTINVTHLETGNSTSLLLEDYSGVMYDNSKNKLLLIKSIGVNQSEYDILSTSTLEIESSETVNGRFGDGNFLFYESYFLNERAIYKKKFFDGPGEFYHIFDFGNGNSELLQYFDIIFSVGENGFFVSELSQVYYDLDTDVLVVGYEILDGGESNGGLFFFTSDYELIHHINLGSTIPNNIIPLNN